MKNEGEEDSGDEDEIDEDHDFFHIDADDNMNEDFLYVVKKSLIIDEWKKRKAMMAKLERSRVKQMQEEGQSALKSSLVKSL